MKVVFFTGAGMSKESGIPTFRGEGGIFKSFEMEKCLHLSHFKKFPNQFWDNMGGFFNQLNIKKPNPAHEIIATFDDSIVITQNIDGFHEDAGSKKVIELHGSMKTGTCIKCGDNAPLKVKCECGGWVKPDIIFYEEDLNTDNLEAAMDAAINADVFVIIGTSGEVFPSNKIPHTAKEYGAKIYEINPTSSLYTNKIVDVHIAKKASEGMKEFAEIING